VPLISFSWVAEIVLATSWRQAQHDPTSSSRSYGPTSAHARDAVGRGAAPRRNRRRRHARQPRPREAGPVLLPSRRDRGGLPRRQDQAVRRDSRLRSRWIEARDRACERRLRNRRRPRPPRIGRRHPRALSYVRLSMRSRALYSGVPTVKCLLAQVRSPASANPAFAGAWPLCFQAMKRARAR
jgi:hypothetical protein